MIKKLGRYLTVDENGCLVPDVSAEKIQPHWRELIKDVTGFAAKDENILSIYIRGSVPRGLAVDGISDLDLLVITRDEGMRPATAEITRELLQKFPFCAGIEWSLHQPSDLEKVRAPRGVSHLAMLLKTQALHIWGKDIVKDLPPVKPGVNTMTHIFNFESEWKKYPQKLDKAETQAGIDRKRLWMGKRLLRTAFELAAKDKPKFTRDLYFCYETAAEEYPEIKDQLYAVLDIATRQDVPREKVMPAFSPVAEFLIRKKKELGL